MCIRDRDKECILILIGYLPWNAIALIRNNFKIYTRKVVFNKIIFQAVRLLPLVRNPEVSTASAVVIFSSAPPVAVSRRINRTERALKITATAAKRLDL